MTETDIKLISLKEVCKMTSLSRTGVNNARSAGRFPKAVMLDGKRIAFVRTEVLEWMNARIQAR
ncbi:helix-turn-helix transcriptional regulator [Rhizobium sp. Rhizsp82]|uniref:helix-turn-helix transcriptional regulator n=1 Tax=Rhizobium sp. Rhizsp82 TaxID=3243057 RepID=UPI0039B5DC35